MTEGSTIDLQRGDLKRLIKEIASHDYAIPYSNRCRIGKKTLEGWYYAYKRGEMEALKPKVREDKGASKLTWDLQMSNSV